jgi:hypothetical protein
MVSRIICDSVSLADPSPRFMAQGISLAQVAFVYGRSLGKKGSI